MPCQPVRWPFPSGITLHCAPRQPVCRIRTAARQVWSASTRSVNPQSVHRLLLQFLGVCACPPAIVTGENIQQSASNSCARACECKMAAVQPRAVACHPVSALCPPGSAPYPMPPISHAPTCRCRVLRARLSDAGAAGGAQVAAARGPADVAAPSAYGAGRCQGHAVSVSSLLCSFFRLRSWAAFIRMLLVPQRACCICEWCQRRGLSFLSAMHGRVQVRVACSTAGQCRLCTTHLPSEPSPAVACIRQAQARHRAPRPQVAQPAGGQQLDGQGGGCAQLLPLPHLPLHAWAGSWHAAPQRQAGGAQSPTAGLPAPV